MKISHTYISLEDTKIGSCSTLETYSCVFAEILNKGFTDQERKIAY